MRKQKTNGAGRRWLLGVLMAGGAVALAACGPNPSNEFPRIPPGAQLSSWHSNGAGGRYMLQIERGRALPEGQKIAGVVRTDTDCEPDKNNLNHCRNRIDLSDGSRIDVIDNHEMARHRCLAPGDSIVLTRFNSDWIIGQVSGS